MDPVGLVQEGARERRVDPTGESRLEIHQVIQDSGEPDLDAEPAPTA